MEILVGSDSAPSLPRRAAGRVAAVALDPSTSIGFGHLVRLACLQDALGINCEMLGPVAARLTSDGLELRRRRSVHRPSADTTLMVVDRNIIGADAIAWRLGDRRRRLIWIRRGLVSSPQALLQSGFVAFADLVIAPGDIGAESGDAVDDLASRQGKLRQVGTCHVYQRMALPTVRVEAKAFLALGAFEESLRPVYRLIREAVVAAGLEFVWSAYGAVPAGYGFSSRQRVPVGSALRAKAACAGLVSEGGYNSLHEALHLARPSLFISNDGNGRERQSLRVRSAKRISSLAFDAALPGDVEAWVASIRDHLVSPENRGTATHAFRSNGFGEMAAIVEDFRARQRQ